jgi:hypothetical protein
MGKKRSQNPPHPAALIPPEIVERSILVIRGETRALTQADRRNLNRFPGDFMFRLSSGEFDQLQRRHTSTDATAVVEWQSRSDRFWTGGGTVKSVDSGSQCRIAPGCGTFAASAKLELAIKANVRGLGYGG